MASPDIKKLSIQEKGLRYKLLVIEALVFVLPFLILSYVFYRNNVFLEFSHLLVFALILVLILAGFVILRQIFDRFLTVTNLVRKAVGGDENFKEIRKDADELHEITASFESLMKKFEETTGELQHRVFELFALKELTEFAS